MTTPADASQFAHFLNFGGQYGVEQGNTNAATNMVSLEGAPFNPMYQRVKSHATNAYAFAMSRGLFDKDPETKAIYTSSQQLIQNSCQSSKGKGGFVHPIGTGIPPHATCVVVGEPGLSGKARIHDSNQGFSWSFGRKPGINTGIANKPPGLDVHHFKDPTKPGRFGLGNVTWPTGKTGSELFESSKSKDRHLTEREEQKVGNCTVESSLGGIHAAFLEAALTQEEKEKFKKDGLKPEKPLLQLNAENEDRVKILNDYNESYARYAETQEFLEKGQFNALKGHSLEELSALEKENLRLLANGYSQLKGKAEDPKITDPAKSIYKESMQEIENAVGLELIQDAVKARNDPENPAYKDFKDGRESPPDACLPFYSCFRLACSCWNVDG